MIAIGSDHGGYELKKFIIEQLGEENVKDYGTFSDSSCDYPDIAFALAKDVKKGICEKGILICKTGVGVLPAEYITKEEALEIIDVWKSAIFEGERHQRRIDKITKFEER